MKISTNENPTLDSSIIAASKDYVAGGSWDSNTPANTYLTLSMNIEKLVCDDARRFECQLSYDNKQTTEKVIKHAAFLAYGKFILCNSRIMHILLCEHFYNRGDYEPYVVARYLRPSLTHKFLLKFIANFYFTGIILRKPFTKVIKIVSVARKGIHIKETKID
jgi:hypothetical protein